MFVLVELESFAVQGANVGGQQVLVDELFEGFEFEVLGAVVIRQNGDAVVELERVRVGCVVDQGHVFQVPAQHPQVFDIHAFGGLVAVFPVQSVFDVLVVGVEVVKHHVRVT